MVVAPLGSEAAQAHRQQSKTEPQERHRRWNPPACDAVFIVKHPPADSSIGLKHAVEKYNVPQECTTASWLR
jgi:hypothetical protein